MFLSEGYEVMDKRKVEFAMSEKVREILKGISDISMAHRLEGLNFIGS